jgi:hypothetical protein
LRLNFRLIAGRLHVIPEFHSQAAEAQYKKYGQR